MQSTPGVYWPSALTCAAHCCYKAGNTLSWSEVTMQEERLQHLLTFYCRWSILGHFCPLILPEHVNCCSAFRGTAFSAQLMYDPQLFVIQSCKQKGNRRKQQREAGTHASRKLEAALCVLTTELSYWPWHTSPSLNMTAGSLPSFLECAAICELEPLRVYEQSCWFIYSQLIMLNCKQSVCFSSADNYPLVNISLKYLQHLATVQNCYIKTNILSQ